MHEKKDYTCLRCGNHKHFFKDIWWFLILVMDGVGVRVTPRGHDLLMPQDLFWHSLISRNKKYLRFRVWIWMIWRYFMKIQICLHFYNSKFVFVGVFHIVGNPRLILRRSSLHHSWVSLNLNALFTEQIFINITQSN